MSVFNSGKEPFSHRLLRFVGLRAKSKSFANYANYANDCFVFRKCTSLYFNLKNLWTTALSSFLNSRNSWTKALALKICDNPNNLLTTSSCS